MKIKSQLSRKKILGYAMLAPSLAFVEVPLYLHIPKYYHAAFGLNLGIIGFILLIVRSLDAIKDPLLGIGLDKLVRAKFSYKQIIGYALAPFILSYYLLFHPTSLMPLAMSLALALFCIHFLDSLLSIAYLSLGAVITDQYHDRTRIAAYREGIKVIGVIIASLMPVFLLHGIDTPSALIGSYTVTTYILCILVIVGGLLFHRLCPEPIPLKNIGQKSIPLGTTFKRATQYLPFRNLVFIYGINALASAIPTTLIFFFIDHVLEASSQTFVFLMVYFMAAVLGMGLWTHLAKTRSKKFSWLVGMIVSVITFSFAFWIGREDIVLYGLICFFSGLCLGADVVIPPAIFADIIDKVDPKKQWHTGFFGVWSVTTKLATALAAGISLSLLDSSGFSLAPQSPSSIRMLYITYALIPCLFKSLAAILLYYSPIDQKESL